MLRASMAAACLAVALLGGAEALSAAPSERVCRGTIGAQTVARVRVPAGAYCVLAGTTVQGNVVVARNATLVAGGVRIRGTVHAQRAKSVSVIVESRVSGSVRVERSARAVVTESTVAGSVRLTSNRGPVTVTESRVGADVQLVSNVGKSRIWRNVVDGDLVCTSNKPGPTGGANDVGGRKRGQCRQL
jgi:hypothetical protein